MAEGAKVYPFPPGALDPTMRLTLEATRPGPEEMRRIFAGLGLTDPFWDPSGDQF